MDGFSLLGRDDPGPVRGKKCFFNFLQWPLALGFDLLLALDHVEQIFYLNMS